MYDDYLDELLEEAYLEGYYDGYEDDYYSEKRAVDIETMSDAELKKLARKEKIKKNLSSVGQIGTDIVGGVGLGRLAIDANRRLANRSIRKKSNDPDNAFYYSTMDKKGVGKIAASTAASLGASHGLDKYIIKKRNNIDKIEWELDRRKNKRLGRGTWIQ